MERIWRTIQTLYERMLRKTAQDFCVWMFHEIKPTAATAKNPSYCISQTEFEKFIVKMQERYEFVSVDAVLQEDNRKKAVLTFDDGFEDIFLYVYPFLKAYNIPFCIFVTTNYIGQDGYLTAEQIQILNQEPLCTIGGHTQNHTRLRYDQHSEAEIKGCKESLESLLKKEVKCFAYPYGTIYACSLKNIKEVKKAGYRIAFSTMQSKVPSGWIRNTWFIPRINVNQKYIQKYLGE